MQELKFQAYECQASNEYKPDSTWRWKVHTHMTLLVIYHLQGFSLDAIDC